MTLFSLLPPSLLPLPSIFLPPNPPPLSFTFPSLFFLPPSFSSLPPSHPSLLLIPPSFSSLSPSPPSLSSIPPCPPFLLLLPSFLLWYFTNYATCPWLSLFCPWLSLVCPWLSRVCPCLSRVSSRMSLIHLVSRFISNILTVTKN